MTVWIAVVVFSALKGFICARKLSGRMGAVAAGASMWPIAQLFGGTLAAVVGVVSYAVAGRGGRGGASRD